MINKIIKKVTPHLLSSNKLDLTKIVIAGWEASGSTFLYQVIKLLGLSVKKIHGYNRKYNNYLTFFTFRDPRDVICSQARRVEWKIWESQGPETAILLALEKFIKNKNHQNIFLAQKMKNVILIRYEHFFNQNEKYLISFITDQFFIPLDKNKIEDIYKKTSLEANLERQKKFKTFH